MLGGAQDVPRSVTLGLLLAAEATGSTSVVLVAFLHLCGDVEAPRGLCSMHISTISWLRALGADLSAHLLRAALGSYVSSHLPPLSPLPSPPTPHHLSW